MWTTVLNVRQATIRRRATSSDTQFRTLIPRRLTFTGPPSSYLTGKKLQRKHQACPLEVTEAPWSVAGWTIREPE